VDPDSLNPDPDLDPALKVYLDAVPDWIWIQGFDDQKLKKKITVFLIKLQFTYVQAIGEDFSPQKRTSSTSKNEIF
jgi:hypothetical protein